MNNTFLLLSSSIFFLSISTTACSKQESDNSSKEQVAKNVVFDNSNTDSPYMIQKSETEAEKPNGDVCQNKEKIDVWFYPDQYNEDTSERILLHPQTYFDEGYTMDDKDELNTFAESIIYRGDLNDDLRTDIISANVLGSYMGEFPLSIFINCGNNQFITSLWQKSQNPGVYRGVKVLKNDTSSWKLIQTQNEAVAGMKADNANYGYDITYEFKNGYYQLIKKVKSDKLHSNIPLK